MPKDALSEKDVNDESDCSGDRTVDVLPLLRAIGTARKEYGLAAEEMLIFLAVGRLGLRRVSYAATIWPVTCLEISELLEIPRETVRRKTGRLIKCGLVSATGRGFLLNDIAHWRRLAGQLHE